MIAGLATTLLLGSAATQAKEFEFGEISADVHGSVALGAQWTADEPNPDFIYQGNADAIGYGSAGAFNPNLGRTQDDGRLNFRERGMLGSTPAVLTGEVNLKYRNLGLDIRGHAWYDYMLENREVDFGSAASGYGAGTSLNDTRREALRDYQLDIYSYGDFKVGERDLHLGLGGKELNWGQGLFFQNGINAINPYDLAALRMPGTPLRLPVPMAYSRLTLTDGLALESFYQLEWRRTLLDSCGTAFSTVDYIADACAGTPRLAFNDLEAYGSQQFVHRSADRQARDDGQFGLAIKYKAASLNTEFGAYAMNIHSREPFISVIANSHDTAGSGWRDPLADPQNRANNSSYFVDYPEDIRIYGLSFRSDLFQATKLFGEISYRPNQPVQLATTDLVPAFVNNPDVLASLIGQPLTLGHDAKSAAPGSIYEGYDRREISQFSLGAIQPIPNVLGAQALVLVGEVGVKFMHDLPSLDERRYNKGDVYGSDGAHGSVAGCALGAPVGKYKKYACTADGYTSDLAWGYRLRAQLLYPDVVKGLDVKPYMMFGHDVNGWSWDSNFVEGRQQGRIGIGAEYNSRYTLDLHWSGSGNTPFAPTDRDYFGVTLSAKF
ncbi:DUF1302 domain-containing protein [Microbulbifer donghaiensis]|uniref:DUF1302 domain-containing protein n=1 Tax=Microbulbifer donghaiensis TaxID=494016 RepID=UPI00190E87C8|nr:DUF1302 domain-containing protein [Microbulbifer donghaiensis]